MTSRKLEYWVKYTIDTGMYTDYGATVTSNIRKIGPFKTEETAENALIAVISNKTNYDSAWIEPVNETIPDVDRMPADSPKLRKCEVCGKQFEYLRKTRLYCSDVCRQRAVRNKKT